MKSKIQNPESKISLIAVAVLCCCSPAAAQRLRIDQLVEFAEDVQLPEADNVARSHLETIERFLEAGQWDEAIEPLRRLMDVGGERLLAIPRSTPPGSDGFLRYVSVREYCQIRLAALHGTADEALALYRARVDSLAANWLREAIAAGDPELFRRVTDRFFVSSAGDQALFRLGELELTRGHFTLAREAWQSISPQLRGEDARRRDAPDGDAAQLPDNGIGDQRVELSWLAYPDTRFNLTDVRARLVLVSILEGSADRAEAELEHFRRLHGDAAGTLAGRRGPYADLLAELLQQSRQWAPLPPPEGWATFGGAATRGKVAPGDLDVALRPIWTVELPRQVAQQQWIDGVARPGDDAAGLLSYHPLVAGQRVIVCTGEQIEDVRAYDLASGRALWPPAPPPDVTKPAAGLQVEPGPLGVPLALGRPGPREQLGVPRWTMTAEQDRLYVKLGTQATSVAGTERFDPPPPGYLAALDLQAEKKRLFEIRLEAAQAGSGWAFEGAPLVDGENLFVALRRRENLRSQSHVACYTMRRNRAELRWRTYIVSAESPGQGELDEYTHTLLTLDQGLIYLNTNLGAVAAVNAADGAIKWLTRYPRAPLTSGQRQRSGRYLLRDLNPCLIYRDLVIAAPADCDRLFALDAATGMLVWDAGAGHAEDAVHLLGVGGGNLLASGDRLYWFDIRNGSLRGRFPERIEADLRGYGRGVLVGDQVYWPTRQRIYVLAQDGPRAVRQPIELAPIGMTGGNLVPAGQTLLIAGADRLAAYNPWGRQVTRAD